MGWLSMLSSFDTQYGVNLFEWADFGSTQDLGRRSVYQGPGLLQLMTDEHVQLIYLNYTGIVEITPALGAILGGSPEAKSTPFGNSCLFLHFLACKEPSD